MSAHVIVPGVFDVMHAGHYNLLAWARGQVGVDGRVIVAIDSDTRIRKTKRGVGPVIPQDFRAADIRSLIYADSEWGICNLVSEVHIITTDDEFKALVNNKCVDFIIKGSDWQGKPVLGDDLVRVLFYPVDSNGLGDKISSSKIIEMVLAKYYNEEDEMDNSKE